LWVAIRLSLRHKILLSVYISVCYNYTVPTFPLFIPQLSGQLEDWRAVNDVQY